MKTASTAGTEDWVTYGQKLGSIFRMLIDFETVSEGYNETKDEIALQPIS